MFARVGVVVLGLVAACASTPVAPGERPELLSVDQVTGHVVTREDAPVQFSIDFADRDVRMPQSISFGGSELVGVDACPVESGIGIGVFPAINAVAPIHGGPPATGALVVTRGGPVVAEVRVTWTAQYMCPAAQQAEGSSTFEIFPNGRIVRYDVAKPSTSMLTANPICGCDESSGLYFTTFWTFASGAQVDVLGDGSPWTDGMQQGCTVYGNRMVGVSWSPGSTRITKNSNNSAYVYDWVADSPTLSPDEKTTTSAIVLSKETALARCSVALAELADPGILVNGAAVGSDELGVHVVRDHHGEELRITPQARIPSFALSIDVGDFAEVTRDPPIDGDWYFFQPDGDRTLFWFRDGLAPGEAITIDPR